MKIAQVDLGTCEACAPCPARAVCRTKALIKMGPDKQVIVKPSDCTGCGDCAAACPFHAISMKEM